MEKLDKATLAREMGPDVELERIRAGLRCGACGGRDALLYRIWEGAGEFKYGDGCRKTLHGPFRP